MVSSPFQFAVAATFTADPLEPVLSFWGRQVGSEFAVRFAGYNQVQQALLDPTGAFARNTHGVNVALIRIEDLAQFSNGAAAARHAVEENFEALLKAVRSAGLRLPAPLIVVLCPPSNAAPPWLDKVEALAHNYFEDVSRLHILRWREVLDLYPVEKWNDPDAERLGRIPYTQEFFCALGTAIARLAHSLSMPPYKAIVFDCDNTLWTGVCGEDGPEGVVIDHVRTQLQQFALGKREEGALLAIASKNDEQDVLDTFAAHPEMPLRLDHFAARRINWDPKPRNLTSLAAELSLGLDSFVFLDDNPRECAEVEDALPEVLSLTLPDPPSRIPHFLRHIWAFDQPVVTEDDRRRNAYYTQAQEFGRELKKAETLESFLASLRLSVEINPIRDSDLPRAAQLTQRTNQFNFTTIRRTESEISELLEQPGVECLTARVSDRFGDHGLVGVVITSDAVLDTFLLSCRVLGRGVEHRILAEVARRALARGHQTLTIPFTPTAKNLPARQFLSSVSITPPATVDAASLTQLTYQPTMTAQVHSDHPPATTKRKFVDFARIARDLSTPAEILVAMRRPSESAIEEQGLSETESRLAAIWRDLLGTPSVSRNHNFFDIGGHSLLAVLLIVRVKEELGIELPVEDVYSPSMTLESLARKIDNYRLSGVNPSEYADLVAEIEQLSEEEVERLLKEPRP